MRFGLNVGTHDIPQESNQWDVMRSTARMAEQVGFDSIWLNDHVMSRDEADPPSPSRWLECFVALGALAAETTRVQLGALVAAIPYRNPALLAKMSTTLDIISHGRSIIGIGAGWHQQEFEAYDWPFPAVKDRMNMLEEAAQIIKIMSTELQPALRATTSTSEAR